MSRGGSKKTGIFPSGGEFSGKGFPGGVDKSKRCVYIDGKTRFDRKGLRV